MKLTPKQRQYLRSLAHPLSPIVRIGRARVSPEVIKETQISLEAHELIKVRIDEDESETRSEFADTLALAAAAQVVGVIGKTAILYRARMEKPKIKLPIV
jgi:RNA-binding protein